MLVNDNRFFSAFVSLAYTRRIYLFFISRVLMIKSFEFMILIDVGVTSCPMICCPQNESCLDPTGQCCPDSAIATVGSNSYGKTRILGGLMDIHSPKIARTPGRTARLLIQILYHPKLALSVFFHPRSLSRHVPFPPRCTKPRTGTESSSFPNIE